MHSRDKCYVKRWKIKISVYLVTIVFSCILNIVSTKVFPICYLGYTVISFVHFSIMIPFWASQNLKSNKKQDISKLQYNFLERIDANLAFVFYRNDVGSNYKIQKKLYI